MRFSNYNHFLVYYALLHYITWPNQSSEPILQLISDQGGLQEKNRVAHSKQAFGCVDGEGFTWTLL